VLRSDLAVLCVRSPLLEKRMDKEQTGTDEGGLACRSCCGCLVLVCVEINFSTTLQKQKSIFIIGEMRLQST